MRNNWMTFFGYSLSYTGEESTTLKWIIIMLFHYIRKAGKMWLNISELPFLSFPYSIHQCSACAHIGLNFSNTSKRWEMLKITFPTFFLQEVFVMSLWLLYNFLPPTLLDHILLLLSLFEGSKIEQLKNQRHFTLKNLHFGICGNAPNFRSSYLPLMCHEMF